MLVSYNLEIKNIKIVDTTVDNLVTLSEVIVGERFVTKSWSIGDSVSKNVSSLDGSVTLEVNLYLNGISNLYTGYVGITTELILCPDQHLQMTLMFSLTNSNDNKTFHLASDAFSFTKHSVKGRSKLISREKAMKYLHNDTLFVYFKAYALVNNLNQFSSLPFNASTIKFVENELTWKVCRIEHFSGYLGVGLLSSSFPSAVTNFMAQFELYLYPRGYSSGNLNFISACSCLTKQSRHLLPLVVSHKMVFFSNVTRQSLLLFQVQNDTFNTNSSCSVRHSQINFEKQLSVGQNQCWSLTYYVKYSVNTHT